MKKISLLLLIVIMTAAFAMLANGETITLPESLTRIEDEAFAGLQADFVVFPDHLEYIAEDAFDGASFVGTGIPESYAQEWCEAHGFVFQPFESPIEDFEWERINGLEARITKYKGSDTNIYIPSSVDRYRISEIGNDTFKDMVNIKKICFPSALKTIGDSAFAGCTGLTSIKLPDGLEKLGSNVFHNCSNLSSINYPTGIKEAGYSCIFTGCTSLTEITIPEGVTKLVDNIFDTSCLETIHLPSTLKEIGSRCFLNCYYITSIDLPDSLITIKSSAFEGCNALLGVQLPNTLKTIEDSAFRGCTAFTAINLPNGLEKLGSFAFRDCINLSYINYPTGLKEAGYSCIFTGCTSLTEITIPEGVTKLVDNIFDTSCLETIHLPSTLKEIGSRCFLNCYYITSIDLPDSLITIKSSAFEGCSALLDMQFPDSLKTIESSAFKRCSAFTNINLPNGLEKLGAYAFSECNNLTYINYPTGLKEASYCIFAECTSLSEITIPEGVTKLVDNIFDTTCLEIVHLPSTLKEIGSKNFLNCENLANINIPYILTTIGDSAFNNCPSLEKIYVSANVVSIGRDAFRNCNYLTIWCEYGSHILNYCQDNSIPYYYLTPDGVNNPSGTLYQGDSYGIHGYARASIPLTEVTATIWNSDKTEIIQTITVHPEQTDYNLSSTVNYNLLFGDLALGSYRYTLIAATELSLETWADTSFTIVPQPLRISLSNFKGPSYLSDENNDFVVHGIIRSNYPITSVSIKIKNIDSAIIATASASPSSTYFSLSDLPITRSSWNGGIYTFELTATSNGETKALKTYTFGSTCASGSIEDIPENEIDDVTAYLLGVNENTFTEDPLVSAYMKEHAEEAVESMIWGNMFNVFSSYLRDILTGKDYQSYLVELYEKEIMDLIADLDESGLVEQHQEFKMFGGAKQFTDIVEDLFGTVGKVEKIPMTVYAKEIKELIDSNSLEDDELLYTTKQIYDNCKELTDLFDGLEIVEESVNIINDFYTNHTTELALLDYIAENYNTSNSKEFTIALNNLRDQYSTEYGKSLKRLFNRLKTTLSKSAEKIITKYVFGEADIIVSLTKAMAKLGLKYSGLKEKGSDNWTVMMRVEEFTIMRNNFNTKVAELKEVSANGTKLRVRQVADLRQFFTNARIALIRLYESLQEVDTPNYPKYSSLISSVKSMAMPGVPAILSDSDVIGGGSR